LNLAEWGADVIKVEPIGGEPSHNRDVKGNIEARDEYFNLYNRLKKGIAVNTKPAQGKEIIYKLLEDADVFLTSYRPQALAKMGLDYETLHAKFPKLVFAAITGFGEDGPNKDDPGFDTVAYWSKSGLSQDIINRGNDVLLPPVAFGDLTCGAVLAGAIGTALFNRERNGVGEKVTLSLYAMALYSLSFIVFEVQTGRTYPLSRFEPALPMMASFKCKDGQWFYMANVDHEKHYGDLMKLLGRDDLVEDERYMRRKAAQNNRVEFIKMLDAEFAKYTRDECIEMMKKADIAYSTINHVADNLHDPQALANDFMKKINMRDGKDYMIASTPVRFGASNIDDLGMGPLLGENTIELLSGVGYSDEEVNKMEQDGIIQARR